MMKMIYTISSKILIQKDFFKECEIYEVERTKQNLRMVLGSKSAGIHKYPKMYLKRFSYLIQTPETNFIQS